MRRLGSGLSEFDSAVGRRGSGDDLDEQPASSSLCVDDVQPGCLERGTHVVVESAATGRP